MNTRSALVMVTLAWASVPSMISAQSGSDFQRAIQESNSIRQQQEQLRQQQSVPAIEDQRLFRPTPEERKAVTDLLQRDPRPRTLNDADVQWLSSLGDKVAWLGAERRIMHDIWKEVTGQVCCQPDDRTSSRQR